MKKYICVFAVSALLVLTSCTAIAPVPAPSPGTVQTSPETAPGVTSGTVTDPTDDERAATGEFTVSAPDGVRVTYEGGVCTVTEPGEYTLSGRLDGRIAVDAGDGEVTLILNGCSVYCADGSPISFISCGGAAVKAAEGSYNTVSDLRTGDASLLSGTDGNDDAAIYSSCDLKINGKGTLIVTSSYDNGIKSKDDLKIKNVTLKVTSPGCALKGNDSVSIESGSLILVSEQSDCVKTKNTGVSAKGNQRGNVQISGGCVDIYAACDGISAAYDALISGDCVINVYTASYAGQDASSSGELYLIVPRTSYSESLDYFAYFSGDNGGVWRRFEYETMVYSGRNASYYGLLTSIPANSTGVAFFTVSKGSDPSSVYTDVDTRAINTAMNGYLYVSETSGEISGDWVQLGSGGRNSEKTTYSSKGVKAGNSVTVDGGTIGIYSKDDGIHANADKLDSGASGKGDVTVNGGSVTITAADDGIHADSVLTVNGGYINVIKSHEGLEGNVIRINGGTVYVYGGDDGLNACKGASSPLIDITGGYLEVTTPSGDTDGIDSNGSITVSGGLVIVKGGASNGGMAGSVDADGSVSVTGGTVIALGGVCEVPGSGSVNTYVSQSTRFEPGEYALADQSGSVIASFTLGSSYSSCWIASEAFALNGSYKLEKDGSSLLSWTQSSQLTGYSGGGFGGGGFGGGGRPGKR